VSECVASLQFEEQESYLVLYKDFPEAFPLLLVETLVGGIMPEGKLQKMNKKYYEATSKKK